MDKVYVGLVNTTHGIKGELKVSSDFKYKDEVFVPGKTIIISNEKYKIASSRNHQSHKLILLEGYDNIDDVIKFRGKPIYIYRNELSSNYILNSDIIGFAVYVGEKYIGELTDIITNPAHEILVVGNIMIPYVDFFVNNIDIKTKTIYINEVEGLI